MRQRVMIAMALACGPRLLLADEPTTALDVTIQSQILDLLVELKEEFGTAILIITHDLGVIAEIADRIAVMYAGEVVESAPVRELFTRPMHPYTQGLLRCLPGYDVPPGGKLGTIGGTVPMIMQGAAAGCGFASRCPFVFDTCRAAPIALAEAAPGHRYRCLLPPDRLQASIPARS